MLNPHLFSSFLLVLSTIIHVEAFVSSNTTDRLALLSFKNSLTNTYALSSWNDSVGMCNWFGVTCSAPQHPYRVTALNLHSLQLVGTISPHLFNLSFIRNLGITGNKFKGSIPREIGRLRWLQFLNLRSNHLEGTIPESLSHCSNLISLFLNENNLRGIIPANLSHLTQLQYLGLMDNNLAGGIPPQWGSFRNLEMLSLKNNNLTGNIPSSIGNISTLRALSFENNKLVGTIPSEFSLNAELGVLVLCTNQLSGKIPPSLFNSSIFFSFDVSTNELTGGLPSDFGQYLPSLYSLYLYDNHFEGPIPLSLANASELTFVEVNGNNFSGLVPPNFGHVPYLESLILASNNFVAKESRDWNFITSLTNCSSLRHLDLSYNNLSGLLPTSISNLSKSLKWLRLRGNQITGPIHPGIGQFPNLVALNVDKNLFSGPIPDEIGNLTSLMGLSLDSNKLSSKIPSSISNLSKLVELFLYDNDLEGTIPSTFNALQTLGVLDLSHNNLRGSIPEGVLSISSITNYLNLSHNSFTGVLPEEIGSLMNLKALDVSNNKFSGEIPQSIGQCLLLDYLNMGGNNFHGKIPSALSNLKGIEFLDLSSNQLSGEIPYFLGTLASLHHLNLSFNDLEGEVPTNGVFSNLSWFSIEGNEKLCGGNPLLQLKSCSTKDRGRGLSTPVMVTIVVVGVLFSILVCVYVIHRFLSRKKPMEVLSRATTPSLGEYHFLKLSFDDLAKATNNFSPQNLIGSGGFGLVYHGILGEDETKVAVKVLKEEARAASKGFLAECEALRYIRHRNLTKILTACSTIDRDGNEFKALVYELMPGGNLERWLHTNGRTLSLVQRITIAIDIAYALEYLHTQIETPVIHCDLKPSNILLDEDMVAHVSDFGISRILPTDHESYTTGIKGSIGYIAPECGMGSKASTMWDVYSYGILLLELLTGKKPTDEAFVDGLSLHKYVQASFPHHLTEILDPCLVHKPNGNLVDENILENIMSIVRVGLVCSADSPSERMQMEKVVNILDKIRDTLVKTDGKKPLDENFRCSTSVLDSADRFGSRSFN